MNKIKKAYQYLFYKIYRFSESMPHPWWSDMKASSIITALILCTIFALGAYYRFFYRYQNPFPNKLLVITICLVIVAFNYYIFSYKDKWKNIVRDFDKLPKRKNKIGGWLVFLFILMLIANFLFSMYLGGTVDWSQYR